MTRKPPDPVDQYHVGNTPYFPVQSYNGMVTAAPNRAISQASREIDHTPKIHRMWTNLGYNDVQLRNGLGRGVASGHKFPYFAQMYVWNFIPRIPGQTRGDVGGFHKRGPSSFNVQDWAQSGPGSQPEHPGGPGQVVGSNVVFNPMSG